MEAIQIFIFGTGLGNLAVLGAVDEEGMQTFVQTDQQHFFGHSTHFMSYMSGVRLRPGGPELSTG